LPIVLSFQYLKSHYIYFVNEFTHLGFTRIKVDVPIFIRPHLCHIGVFRSGCNMLQNHPYEMSSTLWMAQHGWKRIGCLVNALGFS
jgi:hypothetical protein